MLSAKARVTPIYPVDSNLTTLPAGYTASPLDSPFCAETAAKYYYYRYQISVLFKQINIRPDERYVIHNFKYIVEKIVILLRKIEELNYCDTKMEQEAFEFTKLMRLELQALESEQSKLQPLVEFWEDQIKDNAEARKDIQDLNKL